MNGETKKKSVGSVLYDDVMGSLRPMIPFVAGGGILMAISFMFGMRIGDNSVNQFAKILYEIGHNNAMLLMIPIFAGFIAHTIAGQDALAPGMMVSKVRFFEGKESLLGCETPIYKISTTFFDQDKINALKDDIHGIDQLHAVSTSKNDLEITHVNAQKGTALLRYAQTKKITPSQILAVGDSGNDLSMLSLDLGVTAAMANASAAVKDVCSVIAPSNDQDGVAFLIEDILEQNELAARVRRSFCLALDYSKI